MKHLHLVIAAAVIGVVAVAAGTGAVGLLPLALIALCPLAMVFMMRRMHGADAPRERLDGLPDAAVAPRPER